MIPRVGAKHESVANRGFSFYGCVQICVQEICVAMVKSVIDLCVRLLLILSLFSFLWGSCPTQVFCAAWPRFTYYYPRSSHPCESPRKFVLLSPMLPFVYNTQGLPLEWNISFLHSNDALRSDILSSSLHDWAYLASSRIWIIVAILDLVARNRMPNAFVRFVAPFCWLLLLSHGIVGLHQCWWLLMFHLLHDDWNTPHCFSCLMYNKANSTRLVTSIQLKQRHANNHLCT